MLSRPICESIKEWAQNYPRAECTEIIAPCQLDRRLPNTLEESIHPIYLNARHKDVPAKYLARLPEVKLFGVDGMLILPTGCFALEWAFLREQLEAHPDATRTQTAPVEKKSGAFYSLLRIHWQNYNHWLHDCLMRLYAVQDLLPPDTQFIVPADLKPNWQSALQALGIPKSRQVAFDGQTTWQLETLYFTSHTRRASFDLPAEVNWFRTQMWQGCGIGDGFRPQTARHPFSRAPRRTRLYLSRRGAEWRKIVNDAEVARFLRRYSFESHVLEDLSFCKQVELFANAEFVIACHGAGNTNMLFAPPQATLVEIFSPRYVRNDFWAMCDAAQVNYWYMLGQAVPAEHTPLADDIHVPLEKLKQLVTAVLARPHS